jgi:integrase
MSSVRARKDGRLFFDFRFGGERCRELSQLHDTPANRRKMERVLAAIDDDIAAGTFSYERVFPGSKRALRFAKPARPNAPSIIVPNVDIGPSDLPLFADFVQIWKQEKQIEWRVSYRGAVESIVDTHLLPRFGHLRPDDIQRPDVLQFRSALANQRNGKSSVDHHNGKPLAPATINRIVGMLGMIMSEASLRYGVNNPCAGIKRLKIQRQDVSPFTLDELRMILARARADYRPYLTFRFFTGLRSGEVHGLKWKYVDFPSREVLIRETHQHGRTEYTKTDGSQREIQMSQPVYDSLMAMRPTGFQENPRQFDDEYVFRTRTGQPIDNSNFVDRVWKPLLRHLGLKYRRPYNMRHTCATLWLAAGEAPEWIARQLGHTTTEMLFRTYSRFVPNLVRRDGTAFDRMIAGAINGGISTKPEEGAR